MKVVWDDRWSISQNLASAPSRYLLRGVPDPGQAEKNSWSLATCAPFTILHLSFKFVCYEMRINYGAIVRWKCCRVILRLRLGALYWERRKITVIYQTLLRCVSL